MTVSQLLEVSSLSSSTRAVFSDSMFQSIVPGAGQDCSDLGAKIYCKVRQANKDLPEGRLHQAVENALKGGRRVLVKGPAGVGKSALIRYYFSAERPGAIPNERFCFIWLDLKHASEGFTRREFFERVRRSVERSVESAGLSEEDVFRERFQSLRLSQRVSGDLKAAFEKMIASGRDNDEVYVVAAIQALRSTLSKQGRAVRVFFVVDNMDTMPLQVHESVIRRVIDMTEADGRPIGVAGKLRFADLIDCTLVSVRPETLYQYRREQIPCPVPEECTVAVSPVDLAEALKLRLKCLTDLVNDHSASAQFRLQVKVPHVDALREVGGARIYWGSPSDLSWFDMLIVRPTSETVSALGSLSATVESALRWERGDKVVIQGARATEAWSIFRKLCGRVMRRTCELASDIVSSEILLEGTEDRAYPFLNSFVEGSFKRKGVVTNVFVLQEEFSSPWAVMCLPVFCAITSSEKFKSKCEEVNEFAQRTIPCKVLKTLFLDLGFPAEVRSAAFEKSGELMTRRLIQPGPTGAFRVVLNLIEAHAELVVESAYIDNVAQELPREWLRGVERTGGWRRRDLRLRVKQSGRFLAWLMMKEFEFHRSLKPKAVGILEEYGWQSVSLRALVYYVDRLEALIKLSTISRESDILSVLQVTLRRLSEFFGLLYDGRLESWDRFGVGACLEASRDSVDLDELRRGWLEKVAWD